VAEVVATLRPRSVLDAGCGEGFVTRFLWERFPSVTFFGLDVRPAALDYARHLIPAASFVRGDVTRMPFPDQSFDLVVCFGLLSHLEEPRLALRECGRVSRRHVLVSAPDDPYFRLANLLTLSYVRTLGSPRGDPAVDQVGSQLHHWNQRGFSQLVAQELEVESVMSPFPWTLVLAAKGDR